MLQSAGRCHQLGKPERCHQPGNCQAGGTPSAIIESH
jgi:hypothetical protein